MNELEIELAAYQKELAVHISQRNSPYIYVTQPQALLRSVIVIKFVLDAKGKLLSRDILRSNRDKETEQIALASLTRAQNFPVPSTSWFRHLAITIILGSDNEKLHCPLEDCEKDFDLTSRHV